MTFEEATKSCYDWWEKGIRYRFLEASRSFYHDGHHFPKISCKNCSRYSECYYREKVENSFDRGRIKECGFYKDDKIDHYSITEENRRLREEYIKNRTEEEKKRDYEHMINMLDLLMSNYYHKKDNENDI